MKYFKSRFSVQVAKMNGITTTTQHSECVQFLQLLASSGVLDPQLMSILAAPASKSPNLSNWFPNDDFLKVVTYQAILSVVKQ